MDITLKKIKDLREDGCVSIIFNTHRSSPDNEKDPIQLKNLVKEAEERLTNEFDKDTVKPTVENLHNIVKQIDHQQNLESLVIFANKNMSDFTRLPIEVEDRVVIDNTFHTRDLVRAMHQETAYYLLILNKEKVSLYEAFNDRFVKEVRGEFPMENTLYTTDRLKASMANVQENYIQEFFNRVDKTFDEATKSNPLPLVLVTESRNFDHYTKVADKNHRILGQINFDGEKINIHDLVKSAWAEVKENVRKNNESKIEDLKAAVTSGKFLSDINDIFKALKEGKGDTLFVKQGYFQPATLDNDHITFVEKASDANIVDDIVDELIELNLSFGGATVFVTGNELDKFYHLALVTRY